MGRLRCWVIRGLILAALAGVAAGGWVAHDWVSPDRVRAALVAALAEQFPDADVQVGSARLRLFGGISVTDLKLTRRGDDRPFFEAPAAVIYHDKQQLGRGQLVVRKVELDGPTVRLDRRPDGTWNIAGLSKPGPPDRPVPTLVVRNATVLLTDRRPGGLPPVALLGAKLSLLNDPVLLLKVEAQFTAAPGATGPAPVEGGLAVPVGVSARLNRATGAVQAHVEVPDLAVGPDVAAALDRLHPGLAEQLAQFTAHVGVKADLALSPEPGKPPRYDVLVQVRDGRWESEYLPWPVEHLTAEVRVKDGKVTVEKGAARLGKAAVDFKLETRTAAEPAPDPSAGTGVQAAGYAAPAAPGGRPASADDPLAGLEEKLDRLDVTVRDLALDDELAARLPARAKPVAEKLRRMFSPVGAADLNLKFERTGLGWQRTVEFRPNRLAIAYEKFRYPVEDLSGWVRKVTTSDGADEFRVQVTGTAGGRRVEITGRVGTEDPDPLIDLKIAGTDVPIDDRLFAALPKKYADALKKLHAAARADFVALIRQPPGVNRCDNTFDVRVYDGSVNYAHFPYPLAKVRGRVVAHVVGVNPARPAGPGPVADTVRLYEFEGVHADGRVWVPTGGIDPIPGTDDRRFTLQVQGWNCPIDADLRAAAAALKVDGAWDTFAPRGHVTFGADVEVTDRHRPDPPDPLQVAALPGEPPFDPATDLRLKINFQGLSVTPAFLPYALHDLAGVLQYQGGKVDLARFAARHGQSRVGLEAAEVRFGPGGEVWANLGGATVRPLVPDADLLTALPGRLRAGFEALKLRGPMELTVKHLVVKVPPGAARPATAAASPLAPAARGAAPLSPLSPNGRGVGGEGESATGPLAPAGTVRSGGPPTALLAARSQAPPPAPPQSLLPPPADPDPVVYWNAELKLAGASLDTGVEWQDVHGAVASVGLYDSTRLGAVLGNAWFDRATIAKQPVTAAKLTFRVRPQEPDPRRPGRFAPPVVEFPDLTGTLYQGTVGGEARVVLDEPARYRVWLTASGVRLDELARECKLGNGAELRGLAQGKLLLENPPDPKTGRPVATGAGQIDVPNGRMYNLPVLLPMLKLLKLQAPDQTAFEEAHAVFDLKGDRVKVSQLDLIGTAVSLGGSGELDTALEDVRFEFYTIWSQALKRWLTTPVGDVTSLLSGSLFKIEMVRQRNGEMTYQPHMLPVVTDPVRAVAERLRNRLGRPDEPPPAPPPPAARAAGPR